MALCDASIYRFVKNKYFDVLEPLSPTQRAAEIFRLEIENLSFELKETDEIFGWYTFDDKVDSEDKWFPDTIPDEEVKKIMVAPLEFGSKTVVDKGHTLIDYGFILDNGLLAYQKKIEAARRFSPEDEYLLAMESVLHSTKKFVEALQTAAEENVNHCKKAPQIKEALLQVPFYPARNFREAIQSVWILHFLLPLAENAWYSISLGRFDQYVYPYYKKSVSDGMKKEEAKQILYHFYQLLNSYADGACLLNIGPDYNELSKLLIECQRDFSMPGPILGARIAEETPDAVFNMLIHEKLFSMGQPTFYGETSCIHALMEKGIPQEAAKKFSNNSCMGISLPGEEFNSMWGCVFSVSAALEAAVNNGKIIHKEYTVPGISDVDSLDALYEAFEKSATYLFAICAKAYKERAAWSEQRDPDPFVSILTNGCIEKHCDRISGAKYQNVTVECMGLINVSDGICAIDKLVFREKKYTLNMLCEAVRNNFRGYEKMRKDILKCGKFGQNSEADLYAVKVSDLLRSVIKRQNQDNIIFCPSLHTLDTNVSYGNAWGAGFDGRYAQTPFAKNAGPSNDVRKKTPTDLVLSSAKLPQSKFFGGQPIDINFGRDATKNHKKEIAALIRLYLQMGGLQVQVNSMSAKVLKDAIENPQKHTDLVVRIGGYSTYFNKLSLQTKWEFAERAEKEEVGCP